MNSMTNPQVAEVWLVGVVLAMLPHDRTEDAEGLRFLYVGKQDEKDHNEGNSINCHAEDLVGVEKGDKVMVHARIWSERMDLPESCFPNTRIDFEGLKVVKLTEEQWSALPVQDLLLSWPRDGRESPFNIRYQALERYRREEIPKLLERPVAEFVA